MTDGRFYSILLVILTGLCAAIFAAMDLLQPKGLNVDLFNNILKFVAPTIGFLLLMAHNSANAAKLAKGQDEIKKVAGS